MLLRAASDCSLLQESATGPPLTLRVWAATCEFKNKLFRMSDLPICSMSQGTRQRILPVKEGVALDVVNDSGKRLFNLQSGWQPSLKAHFHKIGDRQVTDACDQDGEYYCARIVSIRMPRVARTLTTAISAAELRSNHLLGLEFQKCPR